MNAARASLEAANASYCERRRPDAIAALSSLSVCKSVSVCVFFCVFVSVFPLRLRLRLSRVSLVGTSLLFVVFRWFWLALQSRLMPLLLTASLGSTIITPLASAFFLFKMSSPLRPGSAAMFPLFRFLSTPFLGFPPFLSRLSGVIIDESLYPPEMFRNICKLLE